MRICFLSRRFFPAISGMSVYAVNLLRELVRAGHDVTMISQYRGDAFGTKVYGGGPPPPVPGVRVIGLEQIGEQTDGDFERDIDTMVATIEAEHARQPFDLIHAQYGYPTGWAAAAGGEPVGVPVVVSIQGGDGHWVGSCCETHRLAMQRVLDGADALLIGGKSFVDEVSERLGTAARALHDRARCGRHRALPSGRRGARRRCAAAGADALSWPRRPAERRARRPRRARHAAPGGVPFEATVSGIGPDLDACQERAAALGLDAAVRFTGYADYETVPAIYRDADIFLSPTYGEGFSNTILEAMASGLATLSCFAVGVNDCLRDRRERPAGRAGRYPGPGRGPRSAGDRPRPQTAPGPGRPRRMPPRLFLGHGRAPHQDVYAEVVRAGPGPRVDPRPPHDAVPLPGRAAPSVSRTDLHFRAVARDGARAFAPSRRRRLLVRRHPRASGAPGWRVVVATLFTRSVPDPQGFALACQLDKGLDATVDYMALRRAEDVAACRALGLGDPIHIPLPEAPHRGYHSARRSSAASCRKTMSCPSLAASIQRARRRSRARPGAGPAGDRRPRRSRAGGPGARQRGGARSCGGATSPMWRAASAPAEALRRADGRTAGATGPLDRRGARRQGGGLPRLREPARVSVRRAGAGLRAQSCAEGGRRSESARQRAAPSAALGAGWSTRRLRSSSGTG